MTNSANTPGQNPEPRTWGQIAIGAAMLGAMGSFLGLAFRSFLPSSEIVLSGASAITTALVQALPLVCAGAAQRAG